jgi:trans-2,3-dihydro-3-hydroxyanthranilate isomerase
MQNHFFILDVFAEEKYAGNQLAVVLNGDTLTSDEMQRIAREMHFSETTFVIDGKARNDGYDVRIFTPGAEVPFAGHPTLGTAFLIREEIIGHPVDSLKLNLKVGQILVSFSNGITWMKQNEPTIGKIFQPNDLARVLNISEADLDCRFPIEEVSTGLGFLIVPLKNLAAVKRCRINLDALNELAKQTNAQGILVFSPETYDSRNNLNVRVFADLLGVPEDPATGSGNGCLAGYLVKHRYFGGEEIETRVEQGIEVNRPSLIYLKAAKVGNSIEVNVGGRVEMIAQGKLV